MDFSLLIEIPTQLIGSIIWRFDFLKGEKSCPLPPPFTDHGICSLPIINGACRIILKPFAKFMRNDLNGNMVRGEFTQEEGEDDGNKATLDYAELAH